MPGETIVRTGAPTVRGIRTDLKEYSNYSQLSEKEMGSNRWQLLVCLVHHPLLSATQFAGLRQIPLRTAQWHLGRLLKEGWITSYNYQHPDQVGRRPTPLYALTPKALQFLMPAQFSTWPEYAYARDYQRPRLERLFLGMERVMAVREFLLSPVWRQLGWSVESWDEEVSFPYWPVGRLPKSEDEIPPGAPLMAGVLLEGVKGRPRAGRWLPLALEFDQGRFPVAATRERWNHLTMAQDDSRFFHPEECPFPILIIVAKDHSRLQEYLETLSDAAAQARGGRQPFLEAFVTTSPHLTHFHQDPQARVWWSTVQGKWSVLLEGVKGALGALKPYWHREPARHSKPSSQVTVPIIAADLSQRIVTPPRGHTLSDLVQLALSLLPLEKMLLYSIGAHPLLAANELALLLETGLKYVQPALAHLEALALVQKLAAPLRMQSKRRRKRRAPMHAYLLADRGVRYLAAVDGFGRQVRRYVQSRGWALHPQTWEHVPQVHEGQRRDWSRVFGVQVLHWEHTRAENELMLQFHKAAFRRDDQLSWLSELEGRLYYETQIRSPDYYARVRKPKLRRSQTTRRRDHLHHHVRRRPRPYFMPDGRGVYSTADGRFPFVVEVDRTHIRFSNMVDKLRRYCLSLMQDTGGFDGYRLLIVTTGWKRAGRLGQLVRRLGMRLVEVENVAGEDRMRALERNMLPTFITTLRELRKKRIDQPIWLDALHDQMGTCCFNCFAKQDDKSTAKQTDRQPKSEMLNQIEQGIETKALRQAESRRQP